MNPLTLCTTVFERTREWWERCFAQRGAVIRAAVVGVAMFLLITAAVSPIEREHEQVSLRAADGGDEPAAQSRFKEVDADGTRTPAIPGDHDVRFAVMGSSESENFFRASFPSEFPNLAAAMSSRVSAWTGAESRVIRMYTPIRLQHTRLPRLEQLAASDLDADVVVISLPVYGLANWQSDDEDENQGVASADAISRIFLAAYENRPSAAVNAVLTDRFVAYENRYQYSLAQFAPSAFAPVVFRIEDDADDDDAAPPATPPGDMSMITKRVARIIREDTREQNVDLFMSRINQFAAQNDTRVILVQMPLGLHLFSETDRADVAAYAETFSQQIASRVATENVRYLDLHAPDFVTEDEFRDPVHMLDFGGVADAIMTEADSAGWLPPRETN